MLAGSCFVGAIGCARIKPGDEFAWKVVHLEGVNRGDRFIFEVEAYRPDGRPDRDAIYYWEIEWVGDRHRRTKAKPFKSEETRARGDAGTAVLRIYAADADSNLIEVAAKPFQVK
jgi:hypothetical protein